MKREKAMTYRQDECKTFFSQWGPPTVFFGLFIAFGLGACLIDLCYNKSFQNGLLIIPAVSCCLWLIFFHRIRFERDRVTFYYFGFIPSRIDYEDVAGMGYFFQDTKHPEVPTGVMFQLKSGKRKNWDINLFIPEVRKEIRHELESRIHFPEAPLETPDIQKWVDHSLRTPRVEKMIFLAAGFFTFLIGFIGICIQLSWDEHVRTWDKADGIILKNTTKRVKKGKYTKTVADVAYRYTYKGRQYTGARIVYDSKSFPDLKTGTRRQVIVNPKNPQDCAIMFWYRGYWGVLRYIKSGFLLLISLAAFVAFFHRIKTKKIAVPETLKNYIASFPPERFYAALELERIGAGLSNVEMRRPMEFQEDGRYGILRQRDSGLSYIVFGVLLLAAVTISFVIPLCWLLTALIGLAVFSMYVPCMTVFDFQEKKIYCCRRFRPEQLAELKSVSFSEIDHLSCSALNSNRDYKKYVVLFAVKPDGTNIPICRVAGKHLDLLLDLLPELAEKLGHLPVIYY